MVVIREKGVDGGKSELIRPASAPMPHGYELTTRHYSKGSVYLITDKGERRSYGSYYTPDHIVSFIVENTLAPLCGELSKLLDEEIRETEKEYHTALPDEKQTIAEKLRALRNDFSNRILKLRVLDPAM
jgi:hypothetical protein